MVAAFSLAEICLSYPSSCDLALLECKDLLVSTQLFFLN